MASECAGEFKGPTWEEGVVGPWGETIWEWAIKIEWVVLGVCDLDRSVYFLFLKFRLRDRRVV